MPVSKKFLLILVAFLVLAGVFGSGLYIGIKLPAESKVVGIIQKESPTELPEEVDFSLFWNVWGRIENKYVDIAKIKRQEMLYGAIEGMVKSLGDPYSVFLTPEKNKEFQIEISGEFQGVGMEIGIKKNILTVIAPLKGTPAERAGIMAGDKILKIGDVSSADIAVDEAVKLIRGPKGTKVKLTILRNGEDESRSIEIERDVIKIPVLDTETKGSEAAENGKKIVPKDIFVIKLYNFSENSPLLFRQALRQMLEGGQKKLILDLRNNPGGFLEASVDIASWFLSQGEIVVSENYGKNIPSTVHRSKGYNIFKGVPTVVLVNQGSASAAEILAGALKDHGIAKLVGERTFGKGSVQELLPVSRETSLKITIAKWVTPKGYSISEGGLLPDIEIKPTKADREAKRDPVMEKAIEMLK